MNDTIRQCIMNALMELDTTPNAGAFTIPIKKSGALADQLEPEIRRRMARAWYLGAHMGIKWAQGHADGPLNNPYEENE